MSISCIHNNLIPSIVDIAARPNEIETKPEQDLAENADYPLRSCAFSATVEHKSNVIAVK
jgi:hypothetical protein